MLIMDYKKYLFAVFALISLNDAVKVNMQGSLSFGKEVMESLTNYIRRNYASVSGRRALPFTKEADVLHIIIKSTYLCRDLDFCDGQLELFINEYIMVLTKSIEAIFVELLNQQKVDGESKIARSLIFEEELKKCLREIRKLLRNANIKVSEENKADTWIEVIKRIAVMFQTSAMLFANDRLEGSSTDINEVKKKLMQKFVIATAIVEQNYESKLCVEYDICTKSHECTKALNTLLGSFKDMSEENVKIFIRHVSEALSDSHFYSVLSDVTANELQIILNDMGYSNNVPVKNVLMSIQRTVEGRLNSIMTKKHTFTERDVELVHVILSDMDHMYGIRFDPFHVFLTSFYEWTRTGIKLGSPVRTLLKDISVQLGELPVDLSLKLINEVKAFLEITVDPEI